MKWLYERAHSQRDDLFLNDYTYGTIYESTIDTATRLAPYLQGESRIALWSENSLSMAVTLFAASALQKEVVLLNTMLQVDEVKEQISLTEATTLVLSESQWRVVKEKDLLSMLNVPIMVMCYGEDNNQRGIPFTIQFMKVAEKDGQPYVLDVEKNLRNKSELTLSWTPKEEDIFVIINTSATTGKFKSVPQRWGQIEAHVKASRRALGVHKDDNWLITLPMFHVSGLSIIMRTLYNGTRATIHEKFDEDAVLRAIEKERITMISLVPTILQRFVDQLSSSSLRVILLGGEFIPLGLMERCLQRRLPIYKTYGMSETFAQSTTFNILEYPHKLNSVGLPLEGVQIEVRHKDEEGIGEVWITSPMVMTGYLGKSPIEGAFNTDDMGFVDNDGFLHLVNRRKDIIISGGENIYPKEIEDILYEMEGIDECALVPVADEKWGQIPVLCVVSHVGRKAIEDYLHKRIAKYKWPKDIVVLHQFPKNSMGKVLRSQLQDYATQVRIIRSHFE